MTMTAPTGLARSDADDTGRRFRLHRAGILNVWQYDDQEFLLADGRMLLRGANGAGKSKTLEMLLPFAIDGDKARITASARHHTSLLWLMTDGYEGQARVGYIWVEFLRPTDVGEEAFTCGVGIRSSASAKTATAWFFATPQRIGRDLLLEDDGGPLSRPRLEEAIGAAGQVFDKPAAYKEYVGRALFGLNITQYDEVLRLLYWLRQPQVGEDIEPARLADQLAQALPQLDEQSVKAAGDTFDELTAYGEQIERRTSAAEALTVLAGAYAGYARTVVAHRGRAVLSAVKEERRLRTALGERRADRVHLGDRQATTDTALNQMRDDVDDSRARAAELEASPEARDQRRLGELEELCAGKRGLAAAAETRAETSEVGHRRKAEKLERATETLLARLAAAVAAYRALDTRQGALAVDSALPLPPAFEQARLVDPDAATELKGALTLVIAALSDAGTAVGRRLAAVGVLRDALDQLDQATGLARAKEERADAAERAWESARDHRVDAERDSEGLVAALREGLERWAAEDSAPPVTLPDALTPDAVRSLATLARDAAGPPARRLRDQTQTWATRAANAGDQVEELQRQRAAIEAESDPPPPAPALPRTPRPDGAGLWRLVDFADHLTDAERAGLEAALQAAGLLDAWVRPDGRLLDADQRDQLVAGGSPVTGASLADVLRPDASPAGDVDADVIADVLRRISLTDQADRAHSDAAVGLDGSWRLAQLHGRADKAQAQYVGATARLQERRRRLAEIDGLLAHRRAELELAKRSLSRVEEDLERLEGWLRRLPSAHDVSVAWTRVDERRTAEHSAESANSEAQRQAHDARAAAADLRRQVERLAETHALPLDGQQLSAVTEKLRRLDADLRQATSSAASMELDVDRWVNDHEEVTEESSRAHTDREHASRHRGDSDRAASRLEELRASVGSSVADLEERLRALRDSLTNAEARVRALGADLQEISKEIGSAETRVVQAETALGSHQRDRTVVLQAFGAVADVPGMIDAAFAEAGSTAPAPGVFRAAMQVAEGQPLSTHLVEAARACADRASATDEPDVNLVWKAYTDVASGPAADHDPSVAEFGDLVAVVGRDDAGEMPITTLASRVASAVAADRELLTQRERERFEQHVLGELGDAIRRCRLEADELVAAMNRLLGGVTTSQGIRVRLQWKLRDDVPAEAREAVELLGQPVGALLPHERTKLRDALHRLIEASRAEHPELSYGEHLAAALDYRGWFAFRIRYTRPEADGTWQDLHRRSALSQGEQKVLCYLPLFAAAAAHFSSLAGAAPHAPRLVLLDDAFPKIDVRTHPLLFGLLVDLDLDFVITSERLWGDHDTVPSLAIYEALRDPSQRGIAQFEYRWDGRQLRSLG